jgi:hypothetical protein
LGIRDDAGGLSFSENIKKVYLPGTGSTLKYLCTAHRYGDKRIETIARLIIKQGFILEGIYSN